MQGQWLIRNQYWSFPNVLYVLRHPVCIVLLNLTYAGYSTVRLYGWNMLFVLCGCMVEAPCIDCVVVWLRCVDCIVWLYAWGTLFICLYVWGVLFIKCGCMSWYILTTELKLYCNRFVFLYESSQASVGIAVYSGLCLFLHPFQFPFIINCHVSHLIHITSSFGAMSVQFTEQDMKDCINMV